MVETTDAEVDQILDKKPSFLEEFYQLYCLIENRPKDHFLKGMLSAAKITIEKFQDPEEIRKAIAEYKKICV